MNGGKEIECYAMPALSLVCCDHEFWRLRNNKSRIFCDPCNEVLPDFLAKDNILI